MTGITSNPRRLKGAPSRPRFYRAPWLHGLLLLSLLCQMPVSWAMGVYQAPQDFLQEIFAGKPPPPQTLWITREIGEGARAILGHPLRLLRVHYWTRGERSVWILEEIGKEKPITLGIVIKANHVEQMRVLIYRESRGDEVRQPFFLDQFKGAELRDGDKLDRAIDGVSGATLSTRALTKLARLALFLDRQRNAHGPP